MAIQKNTNKMQRYKLTIEYDGTDYCGFQKQKLSKLHSIEGLLEKSVHNIFNEQVKIIASGRTDAGVHATNQTIHFDLEKTYEDHKIVSGLNHYLQNYNIAILSCEKTTDKFHARFCATHRSYKYKIINRRAKLALDKFRAWHIPLPLDIKLMQQAATHLVGTHDFSAFRDSDCQALTPIKNVTKLEIIQKDNNEIEIEISANAFLQHMVRNIVGTLVLVGLRKISDMKVKEILEEKKRVNSGPNAPSKGLYFTNVEYSIK